MTPTIYAVAWMLIVTFDGVAIAPMPSVALCNQQAAIVDRYYRVVEAKCFSGGSSGQPTQTDKAEQ